MHGGYDSVGFSFIYLMHYKEETYLSQEANICFCIFHCVLIHSGEKAHNVLRPIVKPYCITKLLRKRV